MARMKIFPSWGAALRIAVVVYGLQLLWAKVPALRLWEKV